MQDPQTQAPTCGLEKVAIYSARSNKYKKRKVDAGTGGTEAAGGFASAQRAARVACNLGRSKRARWTAFSPPRRWCAGYRAVAVVVL
jgi:hypothetical protein